MTGDILSSATQVPTAKVVEDLRQGMARIKSEGEAREREIKQQRAAEAEKRLADAERQMEDYQRIALLLRASGDRKGLRELVRQAMQLGKRVADDVKLMGEGALAASESDPGAALKSLEQARRHAGAISAQLRGLATLIDDDEDGRKAAEDSAKSVDAAAKNLPFDQVNERRVDKTLETARSVSSAAPVAADPADSVISLIV